MKHTNARSEVPRDEQGDRPHVHGPLRPKDGGAQAFQLQCNHWRKIKPSMEKPPTPRKGREGAARAFFPKVEASVAGASEAWELPGAGPEALRSHRERRLQQRR